MSKTVTSPRVQCKHIIKRLNAEFKAILPTEIPLDQPVMTHSAEEVAANGWLAWYLVPKSEKPGVMSHSQLKKDSDSAVVGSRVPMAELLLNDDWHLVSVHPEFSDAKELFEIVLGTPE